MTLVSFADALLWLLTGLAAVPASVLFFQLATATRRQTNSAVDASSPVPRAVSLAVLMPAHDEARGIEDSIRPVLAQLRPGDRLLVVADNCSDATADIARHAGAEVIERTDPNRRGKGYALDFGVRWLEREPPDVVVVVDADCTLQRNALDRLSEACTSSGRPVQALYLMHAPREAGVGMRIAAFAWLVKNKLRPRGYAAWGLPCALMGTGMAFPWAVMKSAPLATGHLVEDMQLGLDLAAAGLPPLFCEQASVSSVFPTDTLGAASQRVRWEHGHLSVIADVAPRMLAAAIRRGELRLLAMALDLIVPPLASLVLGLATLLLLDAVAWYAGASVGPLGLAVVACLLISYGIVAAWLREGRHVVSPGDLLAVPLYIAGKVPVYVRVFTKRQVDWVRTRRDDRSKL